MLCLLLISVGCSEDTVDAQLTGSIEGNVTDAETGEVLGGVKISTNPSSTTTVTDSLGNFLLENILVDDYSVQAELDGYVTAFEPITVTDNGVSQANIEMSVQVEENLPPNVPELLSPEDGADDVLRMTELVWSDASTDSDNITYTVEVRNGITDEMTTREVINDTMVSVGGLELGVNYFWQVKANDQTNPEVASIISSFRVITGNENRFFYVREVDGNNVIYSGTDSEENEEDTNENEIRITSVEQNSFRPRRNTTAGKVGFLRTIGAETHLFTMNPDGTDINQITNTVPVAGFRQNEVDFTWYDNGNKLYYPHFNRLYSISNNGTGNELVYETNDGNFISSVAVNESNSLIALKINNAAGYDASIIIIDPENINALPTVVIIGVPGAIGGIDFAIDGKKLLYTRDVSGFESPEYRLLDSRVFEYDINTQETVEYDTDKPIGTNDLDAKYSPNQGSIIFVNTSNDGISPRNIYKLDFSDTDFREILFSDAFMPDWK